jgi:hypothetical protein
LTTPLATTGGTLRRRYLAVIRARRERSRTNGSLPPTNYEAEIMAAVELSSVSLRILGSLKRVRYRIVFFAMMIAIRR